VADPRPAAPTQPRERGWVANFTAILVCHFLNFALIQTSFPFIPLYLRELGESESAAIAWTGAMQVISSTLMMVANPIWGGLADRYGRKAMVTRAQTAAVVVFGAMGFTTQAWQVVMLRALQGLVGGSGPALTTLAAVTLPARRLSFGMGIFQTAQFVGVSLGPAIGGLMAGLIGFRGTFHLTAGLMILNTLLAYFVIREPKGSFEPKAAQAQPSFRERLHLVWNAPRLRAPIFGTLLFQTAYATSLTLLPLHIYGMVESSGDVSDAATSVGIVLTMTALGAAIGGTALGWLGGRVGAATVLIGAVLLTAVLLVPQAWVESIAQFALLRFAMGICAGGVVPSLRTILAEEANQQESTARSIGLIYGFNQSAFAGGQAAGAALAAVVASIFGLPATYLMAAAILTGTGGWWLRRRLAGSWATAGVSGSEA
jgi:DHA1 family multidrug resistance protein-like MFS transporter